MNYKHNKIKTVMLTTSLAFIISCSADEATGGEKSTLSKTQKNTVNTKANVDTLNQITDTLRSNPERKKDFRVLENGTVVDSRSGLQWSRCTYGQQLTGTSCEGEAKQLSWEDAIKVNQSFAGYDDWRLPTRYELDTLIYCSSGQDKGRIDTSHKFYKSLPRLLGTVEDCKGKFDKPTILSDIFPNTIKAPYWSATPTNIAKGMGADSAWATYFTKGSGSFGIPKRILRPVRLVRNP